MPQSAADVVSTVIQKTTKEIEVLFERDDMFYTQIESRPAHTLSPVPRGSATNNDRDIRVPLEILPGGITRGWNPDGGSLGSGSAGTYKHATAPVVHLDHAVSWNEAIALTTGAGEKAVENIVKRNLASAMQEFRRNLESLCMHTNHGYLAEISAVSIVATKRTVTIDSGWGFGSRLIRPGMRVQVYNTAGNGAIVATENIVEKVDGSTITMENTTAWEAGVGNGDYLFLSGLTGTPPNGIYGVQYHNDNASTGTWMGLSKATYPNVRAFGKTATGAFSLAAARLCVNQIMIRAGMKKGMGKKLQAWMHPGQEATYETLGIGGNRFVTNDSSKNLNMFFDGTYTLAGAPIVASPNWDKTRIDFIALDNWMRLEGGPIRWYGDDHGRRVFEERDSTGSVKASWISWLTSQFNLFVKNPLCCAYVAGLTSPADY